MESGSISIEADTEDSTESMAMEPKTAYADWSEYFDGLNGTAVIYDFSNRCYTIYNDEAALTRRSPCSTFKITSSLIALENGIITPEDSIRTWSGEIFWNEDWNKDLESLMISPKEQAEVMERIFGDNSDYPEETQNELKKVMLVSEQEQTDISIYGKTGMGKADGIVVDAWFTGFAESAEGNLYFCVHLGRTDGMDVSSSLAKEIAIQIVSDYNVLD